MHMEFYKFFFIYRHAIFKRLFHLYTYLYIHIFLSILLLLSCYYYPDYYSDCDVINFCRHYVNAYGIKDSYLYKYKNKGINIAFYSAYLLLYFLYLSAIA